MLSRSILQMGALLAIHPENPLHEQLSGVSDQDSSQDVMIRMRNLSSDESKAIADQLSNKLGGAEVKRTESVGAVIGSEVTKNAIMSLAVAFIALAAYITLRFEYKIALSALVSILHDLIMVLGFFSFFHLEIDATFLAAILTVVGYSMNEAVVIFDRVRENMRSMSQKDGLEPIVDTSITQTLSRSIFTSLTTFIMVATLYVFGVSSVKEFALPLMAGILCGTYSSVCITGSLWLVLRKVFPQKKA